jgi:hypothetical protein
MENTLVSRLKESLLNFNKEQAIKLSDSIHEMEKKGKELSSYEDKLWQKLSEKIEETKGN